MNVLAKPTQMAVGKSRKQAPHLVQGVCTSTAIGPWNENMNIGLVRLTHSCPYLYFLESFIFVQDSKALCLIKLSVPHTQIFRILLYLGNATCWYSFHIFNGSFPKISKFVTYTKYKLLIVATMRNNRPYSIQLYSRTVSTLNACLYWGPYFQPESIGRCGVLVRSFFVYLWLS